VYSYLAHLSELAVAEGAMVERGQRVGLSGATGRVTGPHLHWTMRFGKARVDPLSLGEIVKESGGRSQEAGRRREAATSYLLTPDS
jgi:murein DD-endopeptidase MepM/ murein hydrolase activator NlpD